MREQPDDTHCPCGHPMDGEWRCLNSRVYGPCESPDCYGVCADIYGGCNSMNGCCDDEED